MDSFRAFRTRAAAFWILTVWASSEESIFTKASATESRRSFAMNFLPYMNQNYFGASRSIRRKFTAWYLRVTRSSNRVQDLKVFKSLAPSDDLIKILQSRSFIRSDPFLLILVQICFRINKQIPSLWLWYKCILL